MPAYNEKGELVPSKIMKRLLYKLIEENIDSLGITLGGNQVNNIVDVLKSNNLQIVNIINIEVLNEELIKKEKR